MLDVVNALNAVDDQFVRMACIDLAFAGGCAFSNGHREAGKKMVATALNAADLDADVLSLIFDDVDAFLTALPKHRELDVLR